MSYANGGVQREPTSRLIHWLHSVTSAWPRPEEHRRLRRGADIRGGEQLLAARKRRRVQGPSPCPPSRLERLPRRFAAVAKMVMAAGDVHAQARLIVAVTGRSGFGPPGWFAKAGADVWHHVAQGRRGGRAASSCSALRGTVVRPSRCRRPQRRFAPASAADLILNAGPAGLCSSRIKAVGEPAAPRWSRTVQAVPLSASRARRDGRRVTKEGVVCFGALAIGNLKRKWAQGFIARLSSAPPSCWTPIPRRVAGAELMAPKR